MNVDTDRTIYASSLYPPLLFLSKHALYTVFGMSFLFYFSFILPFLTRNILCTELFLSLFGFCFVFLNPDTADVGVS